MADEDITLDGKPLQSLRVADLKAALEQRNLPKSGQKNTLIKRLKGALMLENLQKSSSSHSGLQPNSQIGEEMSQNSFIKQYLAKQQELLRQRLEREAQQDDEAEESPAVPEEDDDHSEDNDSSFVSDKHHSLSSQPAMTRDDKGGGNVMVGHAMMACAASMDPSAAFHPQESLEVPGAWMQRAAFLQGCKEPPAPSPPRAVASLSVRVLGQPDRQGLPPVLPRAQEKEGTAPSEPGSAHSVLHLSRSAGVAAGSRAYVDDDENDSGDDESDDDDDWGPGPGGARKGNRAPPHPQQMPPSLPPAAARSKRKLQPPQHIPPPQSPPDADGQERGGLDAAQGPRVASFPPSTLQREDSDSSSRSSSPEPLMKRKPGPLSLLVHKMESEGAFTSTAGVSGETAHSTAGPACSSESPLLRLERKRLQESREMEEERRLKEEERKGQEEKERERRKIQEQEKERKRLEEEKEKERRQLEEEEQRRRKAEQERERKRQEEEKQRQKEEREKERKHQEEEKERKRKQQEEEKRKEQQRQEAAHKGRVSVTEAQDSSSDSDSKSDSDSSSSQSSSYSGGKSHPLKQPKKLDQGRAGQDGRKSDPGREAEKRHPSKREVSEPSAAAVTEVEPDSESSMAQQPPSGAEPENSEGRLEESTTPKAFAARKISLTSSKTSPASADGGAGDSESGAAGGRKRRWGSSTSVTAKKPSISITTDSLKSLIPDIKINQEAVVELHPEELQLSGDEESLDNNRSDQDQGLKIRRTVTQVVPGDNQENGQTNEEEEEEEVEKTETEKVRRPSRDKRKSSVSEEASEAQTLATLDGEAQKVTPSDSLVRRSISQQKSGVSVTIDDPVRTNRQPSPPHGKVSNILHVTNLVRPFTLGQLKELLGRTGSMVEEGFWIDKIKSHCFVTYTTTEEAVATRAALHGVKWPQSNPKVLSVDFSEQDELDFNKGILKPEKESEQPAQHSAPQARLPPLMPERDGNRERDRNRDRDRERDRERERGNVAGVGGVRDLWAEREREMERRERARGEREWDRDKIREFARPGEDGQRSRSRDRERRRRERNKSKERKTEKKEKGDEPPAKLLDDLFLKTKAAPCIYWLPLTEEQVAQRLLDRTERQKERERRRKEQEEEDKKKEEEKKERLKVREKDGSAAASGAAAGGGGGGGDKRGADGDRERERGRDREGDRRRDSGHRPRRPSAGAGNGRRSRSRSNQRDRRR
ncbi:apoptotic chromatin condensation inducer 1b isoform X2 [Xyrichtys novacula]|uniref:Apoptotic chromatin condensation inducer 1b isoform X2 n=1 Tax=Xyrichtys novacula TaxID=13765 RepID=A0AAV1HIZ9_XYRNO|nr:apoptotic chromatin condensation inducer 1b isoform X2 [Xyrichtys novacula]